MSRAVKLILIACAALLVSCGAALGQWPQTTLERVKQIKMLVSDRDEVKKILAEYQASDDDGWLQEFTIDGVNVEVTYSSGECGNGRRSTRSSAWDASEWKVVEVRLSFDDPIRVRDAGIDLSRFTKELNGDADDHDLDEPDDDFVMFSKEQGIAVRVSDKTTDGVVFFPPKSSENKLCRSSAGEREFYSDKGRFSAYARAHEYEVNEPPNVASLDLDKTEVGGTLGMRISVAAHATDPENDVLTYNYTVTGGKIIGSGAKVIWDLTGVSVGTYTITAAVDDGCGICGQTKTKTVTVR